MDCSNLDTDSAAAIIRYSKSDQVLGPTGESQGRAEDYFSGIKGEGYSKVGDYYYMMVSGNGACGQSDTSGQLQTQTIAQVKKLTENLQAK
jgi:hypothetical protein